MFANAVAGFSWKSVIARIATFKTMKSQRSPTGLA
jgi:hypothetical protein